MSAVVAALAVSNPARYATQAEVYGFLSAHYPMRPEERDLYRRLLLEGPIQGRYFALDYDAQVTEDGDETSLRFARHAAKMAVSAARAAMGRGGISAGDVGAVVVSTCTGYLCPGLSTYVAQDLGLPSSVQVLDLAGMGCGAALPNLRTAGHLAGGLSRPVLSVTTEVCSATLFMGPEPDLVVSNSIFGDGAAALVVMPPGRPGLMRLLDYECGVFSAYRDSLRYRTTAGRLRNVLSPRVPVLAGKFVARAADCLLCRRGLRLTDVRHWVVHPGGTAVLAEIARRLSLSQDQLRHSYAVFRRMGNMSSPTVMFVLDELLRQSPPRPGELGMLLTFGAGFTAFAALVEFL